MAALPNPQGPVPLSLEGARAGALERGKAPGLRATSALRASKGVDAIVQIGEGTPQEEQAAVWMRAAARSATGAATLRRRLAMGTQPPPAAPRTNPPPPDSEGVDDPVQAPKPAIAAAVAPSPNLASLGPAATRASDLLRLAYVLLGNAVASRRRYEERARAREPVEAEHKALQESLRTTLAALGEALRSHPLQGEEEERAAALLARWARRLDQEGAERLPAEAGLRDARRHIATLLRGRGIGIPQTLDLGQLSDRLGLPLALRPAWVDAVMARRRPFAAIGALLAFLAFGALTLAVAR